MKPSTARFILTRILGWKPDPAFPAAKKALVLGVPHTSIWDTILIGIAPEGTRKPVKRWKTGYHIIATKAGVPVYAGYINWKEKYISFGEVFPLTDDVRADTLRLQRHYKSLGVAAKHPENFIYDDEA